MEMAWISGARPLKLFSEFKAKGADVVFAFQTRNPTHAGHAYLMRTGRERLVAKGHSNPVLLALAARRLDQK